MSYLVRKLSKRENIDAIGQAKDIKNMFADAATSEFRTKNGTLSTWLIEKIEDLDEAVLAVVVTSSKIERMDFIIINTDFLDKQELQYDQTYAGKEIAVPDLQDNHFDIIDITLNKLVNCACVYREVFQLDGEQGKYIVRYVEGDIKELLKRAYSESRLDLGKLNKSIKEELLQALSIS